MSAEMLILVAGIVTSVLTAAINTILIHKADFNFLSVSHWFLIPTGALIGGMGAASGYYAAAIWTHTMPSRKFLFEMAAIGASTWVLALWLEYATLTLNDGTPARDVIGFVDYFRVQAEHSRLRVGSGNSDLGEMGWFGYVRELLQLLGFMAGGVVVWLTLKDREACDQCRKYAKTKELLSADTPERFQAVMDSSALSFPGLVEDAQAQIGKQGLVGLGLALAECPSCRKQWARPAVVTGSADRSTTVKLGIYSVTADQADALRAAVAALPKEKAKTK